MCPLLLSLKAMAVIIFQSPRSVNKTVVFVLNIKWRQVIFQYDVVSVSWVYSEQNCIVYPSIKPMGLALDLEQFRGVIPGLS